MATKIAIEISLSSLMPTAPHEDAKITHVKHLASYNWIEALHPTIAVPGMPPRWLDISLPKQLPKDTGLFYIAQNAARHPKYPMEPLFRAIQEEHPNFNYGDVGIISDRNNLRKLLAFVDPATNKHASDDFTIDAERIGDAVVLNRVEAHTQEIIGPNDFRGYGHEFEKAYTRCEINESTGHYRIVGYQFCGVNYLVRHETDGFVGAHGGSDVDDSDILDKLAGLSIAASKSFETSGSDLILVKRGKVVPIGNTLEIKTRVSHKPLSLQEVVPQLWISQTPLLVRALYTKGHFPMPNVENIKAEIAMWEITHQSSLHKLARLMSRIIDAVKDFKHAKIEYSAARQSLTIRPVDAVDMLPEDLYPILMASTPSSISPGEPAQPPTLRQETTVLAQSGTEVQIGSETFRVNMSKFPALPSFALSGDDLSSPETKLYRSIPYFDVLLKGVDLGFRQCFRGLGTNIFSYQALCHTIDELGVDVLDNQTLNDITTNLKAGKSDDYEDTTGNKRLARDSAFRLVYYMLTDRFTPDSTLEKNKIYNAVQFVISHYRTFGYKIRHITRAAFDLKIPVSFKQRATLEKWSKDSDQDEDDATTESDSPYNSGYYDFDSDSS